MLTSSKLSVALCIAVAYITGCDAFMQSRNRHGSAVVLNAESPEKMMTRRGALFGIVAATVGTTMVGTPEEASARYSSYTHREQDWAERKEKDGRGDCGDASKI